MRADAPTLRAVVGKTVVVHTVTYFAAGLLALALLDYGRRFEDTELRHLMRPVSDPLVMAGPLFQPIRGALYGLVFYLLRDVVFRPPRGWLVMWAVLLIVGLVNTFGPAPSSIEGAIYTVLPLSLQVSLLPEGVVQTLALSAILFHWVAHPERRWLSWVLGAAFVVTMVLPTLGLLMGPPR
jgi:hypothetical protein